MASLFTRIRTGEIPGSILEDTGEFFALLDIHPKQKGHTLIIPYQEVDYLFDLDKDTYHKLWDMVACVSAKLKATVPCEKIAIMVEGMQIQHVHIHLIPINQEGDLNNVYQPQPGEFEQIQNDYRLQ